MHKLPRLILVHLVCRSRVMSGEFCVGSWRSSGEAWVGSVGSAESEHESTERLPQLQWQPQVKPRWSQTTGKTSNFRKLYIVYCLLSILMLLIDCWEEYRQQADCLSREPRMWKRLGIWFDSCQRSHQKWGEYWERKFCQCQLFIVNFTFGKHQYLLAQQ